MKNLESVYSDSKNVTDKVMDKITYGGKGMLKRYKHKCKKEEKDEY